MTKLANAIAACGVQPLTFINVGAMGGLDEEWLPILDALLVHGFEPDDRSFALLPQSASERYHNRALARKSQSLTLHLTRGPGKTSMFRPNLDVLRAFPDVDRFDVMGTTEIPADRVSTLDAMAEEESMEPDFVKLDTQGSEMDILAGGKRTMENAVGAKIEVEFIPIYKDQPMFGDVHACMLEHGFQLMDVGRTYWKRKGHETTSSKGQLAFGDALYLRSPESIFAMQRNQVTGKLVHLAVAAAVYGHADVALASIEAADIGVREKVALHAGLRGLERAQRLQSARDAVRRWQHRLRGRSTKPWVVSEPL